VTRIKQSLAIVFLMAVTLLPGAGQALPDWLARHSGGTAPAVGILDDARFLDRDPATAERITAGIAKLEKDHGFRIHLIIVSTLIGTTAQEQANELRRNWLPDDNGLIIVFESDTRIFGIGQDMDGNPLADRKPDTVPAYETAAIVSRALDGADGGLPTGAYLESITGGMVEGFDRYFISRREGPPPQRSVRLALLAAGTVSLLGLGAIAVGGLIRHSHQTRGRRFLFPSSDLPERLGAPCGAAVTARNFAAPQKH
jgi:hypothetical protein